MLVNDLLLAASLSLAGAGGRVVRLVGPGQLADILGQLSEARARGRDPWTAPPLAGAGYLGDEPLAVRLTRLALLPASLEGQLVAAWLGQAVSVPEGAGRDQAARMVRQAAGWYLARFPGQAAAAWR